MVLSVAMERDSSMSSEADFDSSIAPLTISAEDLMEWDVVERMEGAPDRMDVVSVSSLVVMVVVVAVLLLLLVLMVALLFDMPPLHMELPTVVPMVLLDKPPRASFNIAAEDRMEGDDSMDTVSVSSIAFAEHMLMLPLVLYIARLIRNMNQ